MVVIFPTGLNLRLSWFLDLQYLSLYPKNSKFLTPTRSDNQVIKWQFNFGNSALNDTISIYPLRKHDVYLASIRI